MFDFAPFGWDELIGIGNIVALLGVAIYAGNKVEQIRAERFTHRQAEVADECLQAVYKTRDALRRARSILISVGEGEAYSQYHNRLNSEEVFYEIEKLRPRVKAYISQNAFERLDAILEIKRKLHQSAFDLLGPDELDNEQRREASKIVYCTGSKADVIMDQFSDIERGAEIELLPIIGRKDQ